MRFRRSFLFSLVLAASGAAQDAAYGLIPRTVTVPAQVNRSRTDLDIPGVPRAISSGPKNPRVILPPGPPGNPEPLSPPVRIAGQPGPLGPGDLEVFANRPVPISKCTTTWSWPPEPVTVIDRDVALYVANNSAAQSIDNGQSWTTWNPCTRFPALDSGFNGDQRLAHDPRSGTTVWVIQYGYSATTQNGSHRLAIAGSHANLKAGNFTHYYDINPQSFGDGAGFWLDFPDVTVGDNFLYGSANVLNAAGNPQGGVLWRVRLADLQAGNPVTFQYYTRAQIGNGLARLCQGTGSTLWAAMSWNTTQLRLLWWPEGGNVSFENKTIAQISGTFGSAAGPDNRDWIGNADNRMYGAALGNGEAVFLFHSGAIGSRTRAFVRVERISTSTRAITTEEDIWHNDFALAYPAIAPNLVRNFGVTVTLGGGTFYPGTYGFIVDSFQPGFAGNTLTPFATGSSGPASNRWGDYFGVVQHPSEQLTWVASGLAATDQFANTIDNRYIWFGREQNRPGWVNVNVTSTGVGSVPVQVAQTDRFAQQNGTTNFTRSYAPRQGLRMTVPSQFVIGGLIYPFERWVWNGVFQATGNTVFDVDSIGVTTSQSLEARYTVPARLDVSSVPGSGAQITVSPADMGGQGSGATPFARGYRQGTNVTLTAPLQLGNDVFGDWLVNGVLQPPGQRTITVAMNGNVTAVAQYFASALVDVSSFPASGVAIQISPADLNGATNGTTPFNRRYGGGTSVTLTAPATFGSDVFAQWLVQGAPKPVGQQAVTVTANLVQFCVAVYVTPGGGPAWVQIAAATTPPARESSGLAYDPVRRRAVLFGGTGSSTLNDTWEFDGTDWALRSPANRPSVRRAFGFAQDTGRGRAVLFGGSTGTGSWLADTWEWDGSDWALRAPASSPSARFGTALAYDSVRGVSVLFGGSNNASNFADTWEWNGTDWVQRFPSVSPPARRYHALVYDSVRRRTVLFGGFDTAARNDTWEWDGASWTQRTPATQPPANLQLGACFDRNRGRVVLFGTNTWEWDGVDWVQRVPLGTPVNRTGAAMAFDSARGRCLLFGGQAFAIRNDTWDYFAACDVVGKGHAGGGLPITCTTAPVLGTSFCVSFPSALGTGALMVGVAPALNPPLPLLPPLACSPMSLFAAPIATLTANGSPAVKCIDVPPEPALFGAAFVMQGVIVDAGSCLRASDAMVVVLQKP
jgi:hypothetical protein